MTARTPRGLVRLVLPPAALILAFVLGVPELAQAQEDAHDAHPVAPSIDPGELVGSLAHGLTLAATTLIVGLALFVPAVWLPAHRAVGGAGPDGAKLFVRLWWVLLGALVVSGAVELSLYAVRASGEALSPELFRQALLGTRVGGIWLVRLGSSLLVVIFAAWALRRGNDAHRWLAAALGTIPLLTLTMLSHAAAEGRFLPFFADWTHTVAASAWMGGLLGFSALLAGPLRKITAEERLRLLGRAVPRFSGIAMGSVLVLLVTGTYESILHVPSFAALFGTPYGRALFMKLGLLTFVLFLGAIHLIGRGEWETFGSTVGVELALSFGVFAATGFLTSLTPP